MKKETFEVAVTLGKLLKLLSPWWRDNAAHAVLANRFQARVEECLCFLTEAPVLYKDVAEPLDDLVLKVHTTFLEEALSSLISYAKKAEPLYLIECLKKRINPTYKMKDPQYQLRSTFSVVLEHFVHRPLNVAGGVRAVPSDVRGALIHRYSSIVRNDDWLSVLLQLDVELPAALVGSRQLHSVFGSHQGRIQLAENKAVFVPAEPSAAEKSRRRKKVAPVTTDMASAVAWPDVIANPTEQFIQVQVSLSNDFIVNNPTLTYLIKELSLFENGDPLAEVLRKLSKPYSVANQSAEELLGSVVNNAYQELRQLHDKLMAQKEAEVLERKKKAESALTAVVKKLDAGTLKLLQKNPELLLEAIKATK